MPTTPNEPLKTDLLKTMGWETVPFAARVGAEIRNADLREPLDEPNLQALHELIAQNGVVVFTGQHLDDSAHLRVATQLGQPKKPPEYLPSLSSQGFPEISVISTANGFAYTSDQWHADVTWMERPPKYSILHMREMPPAGGDTMWASQVEAFARLSEPFRDFLRPLHAVHQLPSSDDMRTVHPVVCRQPITGKPALFVNSVFTKRICELAEEESDAILAMLFRNSTIPECVCRWRWSVGDVAIWDNHFVQHYAINDYAPFSRKIHRIEIEGEVPLAYAATP
jgi:taurine dioxygenase